MLFLLRPPQTRLPSPRPRDRSQQDAYRRSLRDRFLATRRVAPAASPPPAPASTLVRALRAGIDGDTATLREVLTDDVRVWTPLVSVGSLAELIELVERVERVEGLDGSDHRDAAFSDVELVVTPLDVAGDQACVEWSVALTHSGALALDDGRRLEPTGLRATARGVTVAELRGERICSLRQYWDESELVDQLDTGRIPAVSAELGDVNATPVAGGP